MSYEVQTDNVLTGSLNLLPPGDLLPEGDAVALQNWRVDQNGALHSRLDMTSVATLSGYIHTLYRWNGHRYAGAAGALYRDGASIATGFDGTRLGLASMNGFTWIMNQSAQKRDSGSAVTAWVPAAPPSPAPTLVQQAGGLLPVGAAQTYYVTYVTADGEETNPSAGATNLPNNPNQWCQIFRPTTTDATVTGWNVYRAGSTLENTLRLNGDVIPYATDHFDDSGDILNLLDDLSVTQLGIALETDHDAPPAAAGLVGPYYDRLLAYRSYAHPNWLWWSRQLMPYAWPGAARDDGNHTPVGEDSEAIVTCVLHSRQVRIYKERTVWRMAGDPDDPNSVLEITSPDIGLVGAAAIATVGDLDYFQGWEGIYVGNGYTTRKISGKLDPLFKGDPVLIVGATVAPLNSSLAVRAKNCVAIVNGRLYFSYASVAATAPDTTLVYDIESDRWYSDDRPFTALYYEGQGLSLLGASGATVYALETPQASAITLAYQTAFRDQGKNDRQKTYADLVVEYSTRRASGDVNLTVSADFDNGKSLSGLIVIGQLLVGSLTGLVTQTRQRTVLPILNSGDPGVMARNAAVLIAGSSTVPVTIYSISLHYRLHPRDALTFDSAESHMGYQGAKRIDLVQLDIAASGPVAWQILTDLPGGTMAQQAHGTMAATTGQRTVEIPIDPPIDGRLVRVTLAASATFRLYGVRVRMRHLGMLIDGTAGEVFQTLEQAA